MRNVMLGALYQLGDAKQQETLLDVWKLSKLSHNFHNLIYNILQIKMNYQLYLISKLRNENSGVSKLKINTPVKKNKISLM